MHDSAKPMGRHRVFSLIAGVVVAAVALSPSAYADDGDLFTPTGPSIVVGGTVHSPGTIVVDPDPKPPAAAPGPINPAQPIVVDPRVRVAPPTCCNTFVEKDGKKVLYPNWPGFKVNPPVFPSQERIWDDRAAYLDNHGRYWVLDYKTQKLEQVGGWPATQTGTTDTPLPSNLATIFPPCELMPC
jgi:hypothetical protein